MLCLMFDIQKIFMMGVDTKFYQSLKIQDKDVELVQLYQKDTEMLTPRMAEIVRDELLLI